MTTILLTGFGPYGDEIQNPSGEIAARLDGEQIDDLSVRGVVLPVTTDEVGPALDRALQTIGPDVVVVTGVTPGRAALAVERVALNVRDFPIPDTDGAQPVDEPVIFGGPAAYLSSLPVKAILAAWRAEGFPGFVSNTAGTYVCNQTFYLARHLTEGTAVRAGLIHLPITASRASTMADPTPSLCLTLLERAVRRAAVVAATHRGADIPLAAGAVS